ncbi:MAG: hypothetical protein OXC30_03680 [Alphaproteobacteria bacterium]|nr:hypothetical protein [Alphaproteobacteria bacterium]
MLTPKCILLMFLAISNIQSENIGAKEPLFFNKTPSREVSYIRTPHYHTSDPDQVQQSAPVSFDHMTKMLGPIDRGAQLFWFKHDDKDQYTLMLAPSERLTKLFVIVALAEKCQQIITEGGAWEDIMLVLPMRGGTIAMDKGMDIDSRDECIAALTELGVSKDILDFLKENFERIRHLPMLPLTIQSLVGRQVQQDMRLGDLSTVTAEKQLIVCDDLADTFSTQARTIMYILDTLQARGVILEKPIALAVGCVKNGRQEDVSLKCGDVPVKLLQKKLRGTVDERIDFFFNKAIWENMMQKDADFLKKLNEIAQPAMRQKLAEEFYTAHKKAIEDAAYNLYGSHLDRSVTKALAVNTFVDQGWTTKDCVDNLWIALHQVTVNSYAKGSMLDIVQADLSQYNLVLFPMASDGRHVYDTGANYSNEAEEWADSIGMKSPMQCQSPIYVHGKSFMQNVKGNYRKVLVYVPKKLPAYLSFTSEDMKKALATEMPHATIRVYDQDAQRPQPLPAGGAKILEETKVITQEELKKCVQLTAQNH